jgi:hypothetical protein
MPINTIPNLEISDSKTIYYGIKKMKFQNKQGYEVEQYALARWDKVNQTNVYASNMIGGHITKLTLQEPTKKTSKDGRPYVEQRMWVEFYSDEVGKEVVTFNWSDSFTRTFLSKLYNCQDFTKVGLLFGQSQVKIDGQPKLTPTGEPVVNNWLACYENGNKLDGSIVREQYKTNDEQIILPPICWESVKRGEVTSNPQEAKTDKHGYKVVDSEWEAEIEALYLSAFTIIQKRVEEQRGNLPEPIIKEEVGLVEADLDLIVEAESY